MGTSGSVSFRKRQALAQAIRRASEVVLLLSAVAFPAKLRAETNFTLIPRLGFGVTNNATAASAPDQRARDEFAIASVSARLGVEGARSSNTLGYRLAYTRFLEQTGADSLTNQVSWLAAFHLTGALQLNLTAEATLSRTSQVVSVGSVATVTPQAAVSGTRLYFESDASEALIFQPKPTLTFRESVRAAHLVYLDSTGATTTAVVGILGVDWVQGRNIYSADAEQTGSSTSATVPGAVASGDIFVSALTGGWRRELSVSWAAALRAGAMAVYRWGGPAVVEPVGSASIDYRDLPWFATLTVSHLAATNFFSGGTTVNDQVLLRATVPLTRRELYVLGGYGGFTHARFLTEQGGLVSAYDQWAAGGFLTARLARLPFWAALEYGVVDQTSNSAVTGGLAPNLLRQTILLSIGGTFSWGPGTPPLLQGGVP